jgi:hypothetical protein
VPPADTLLVATRKGLFTFRREGRGWQPGGPDFLGRNVSMILSDFRDGAAYAAIEARRAGPKLHRRAPGASGWEEVAVPSFPPGPEGAEPHSSQPPTPGTVLRIWSLEAGPRNRPGELWCGTVPGGLFQSHDSGRKWELIGSLWNQPSRKEWMGGSEAYPGIGCISLDPRDGRRIVACVSIGGAWFTEDRGATWTCRGKGLRADYVPPERAHDPVMQNFHGIARCAARPEVLWGQHQCGSYRSIDGGVSWSEVQVRPSSFGFAVAAHPKDPDTAWFIPLASDKLRVPVNGRLVVSRTRDGGQSFEELSTGLPQAHAYDVVYRHALAVDRTGNRLAFGTTTGGLYVSTSGGDKWSEVTHHLPPVHAVRFA